MRVALLTYATHPRGGVVHVLALADALRARGHDVVAFGLGAPGERFFRATRAATRVVPVVATDEIVSRVRVGIAAYAAYFARTPERFDIYHAHDGIGGNALADSVDAGRVPGFVRTVHHLDTFAHPELAAWQARSVVRAERCVAVSRLWRDRLRDDFARAAEVIGNGVDTDRFSPISDAERTTLRRSLGYGDEPVFLTIGGIEARKNAIATFACVRARARAIACRPARRRGRLERVRSRPVPGRIRRRGVRARLVGAAAPNVLGVLDDDALVARLRAADALVFPSLREGFGLVVLEALACGTPVVTSRIAPFTEYLRPSDATLVDPLDVGSIAAGMFAALAPAARDAAAANGPVRARDFTWDACAREHERLYETTARRAERGRMPEMTFTVRWPDDSVTPCYSPSLVVAEMLEVGRTYPVEEFVAISRDALTIASQRVEAKYGYPCSNALAQLARIESTARAFARADTSGGRRARRDGGGVRSAAARVTRGMRRALGPTVVAVILAMSVRTSVDAATMTLVDAAVMAPIDALVAGIDTRSPGAVARAYVPSPTITDEFAPFVWRGAGAAKRWSDDFGRMACAAHIEAIRVSHVRPSYVVTAPERAWVVVPTTFRYRVGRASQRETAAWTFALVRAAGRWRIATSTWAKTSDTAS